ncbi:MAG: SDR family NAD(P)-dependent oxidoreductase [Deltaproteobacteria bacterium]|nr:SDR family NAD(P)-dependent oxidoreductase [Deltaproteobacteria bacterium]
MIRPLTDRVIVITGANIGIGHAAAAELARRGARLRLLCRSLAKASPVVDELRTIAGHPDVLAIECDLGSLASVRSAAQNVLARDEPLHVLINNAGVAGQRGITSDGFELQFGVNHLGHFLLTTLLLDRLRASAPARIVHVASSNHRSARGIDWAAVRRPTASISGVPEYDVSKLANVLFSAELARRLADSGVTSYAVNPGRVASNIWQRIPWPFRQLFKMTMLTTEQGAQSTVHAATSSDVISGRYYGKRSTEEPVSARALDTALATELWMRSEAWVAQLTSG